MARTTRTRRPALGRKCRAGRRLLTILPSPSILQPPRLIALASLHKHGPIPNTVVGPGRLGALRRQRAYRARCRFDVPHRLRRNTSWHSFACRGAAVTGAPRSVASRRTLRTGPPTRTGPTGAFLRTTAPGTVAGTHATSNRRGLAAPAAVVELAWWRQHTPPRTRRGEVRFTRATRERWIVVSLRSRAVAWGRPRRLRGSARSAATWREATTVVPEEDRGGRARRRIGAGVVVRPGGGR
jgi:hypothetical protein